jgi:hypothetical protein
LNNLADIKSAGGVALRARTQGGFQRWRSCGELDRSWDRALKRLRFGVRAMLVDGKWSETWKPVQATDAKGGFVRQISSFRSWVTPNGAAGPTGDGGFRAEPGRYHLYASYGCPWATRVLIARKLKGLEDVISVAIVEPMMTDQGWRFATILARTATR